MTINGDTARLKSDKLGNRFGAIKGKINETNKSNATKILIPYIILLISPNFLFIINYFPALKRKSFSALVRLS